MKTILCVMSCLMAAMGLRAAPLVVVSDAAGRAAKPVKVECEAEIGYNEDAARFSHVVYLIEAADATNEELVAGRAQIIEASVNLDGTKSSSYRVRFDVIDGALIIKCGWDCSVKLGNRVVELSRAFEKRLELNSNWTGKTAALTYHATWLEPVGPK